MKLAQFLQGWSRGPRAWVGACREPDGGLAVLGPALAPGLSPPPSPGQLRNRGQSLGVFSLGWVQEYFQIADASSLWPWACRTGLGWSPGVVLSAGVPQIPARTHAGEPVSKRPGCRIHPEPCSTPPVTAPSAPPTRLFQSGRRSVRGLERFSRAHTQKAAVAVLAWVPGIRLRRLVGSGLGETPEGGRGAEW